MSTLSNPGFGRIYWTEEPKERPIGPPNRPIPAPWKTPPDRKR